MQGGGSPSVFLHMSYHKKGEYIIWLRDGDLNCFRDIKPFDIRTGWGMPGHTREDITISVIECVL